MEPSYRTLPLPHLTARTRLPRGTPPSFGDVRPDLHCPHIILNKAHIRKGAPSSFGDVRSELHYFCTVSLQADTSPGTSPSPGDVQTDLRCRLKILQQVHTRRGTSPSFGDVHLESHYPFTTSHLAVSKHSIQDVPVLWGRSIGPEPRGSSLAPPSPLFFEANAHAVEEFLHLDVDIR